MNDTTDTGQPEGEALPKTDAVTRVTAAIEAWHAKQFHTATVEGRPALSADDKASLIQSVVAAVAPTEE